MGKSYLVTIGLTLTLLSLISVDSSNRISHTVHLTRFDFSSNNFTKCEFNSDRRFTKQNYFVGQVHSSPVKLLAKLCLFIYCCLAIGALCEKHFVPSLQSIGENFSLSTDITASILLPLATSAPEIFSSFVGILFCDNEVGTGAIIGSCCYNQLVVPCVCGISVTYFIGKPIKLDVQPIMRDLLFYMVAIIGLIFTTKDNSVDIIESSLLIGLFLIYVAVKLVNQTHTTTTQTPASNPHEECNSQSHTQSQTPIDNKDNTYMSRILMPVLYLYGATILRTCSVNLQFLWSIGWLSLLSYACVSIITDISTCLAIPASIAGMTVLAAGSAVPDLVTAVVMIRKTKIASIGICSAISANIFAILVGLGLPWLIKCAFNGLRSQNTWIAIESHSLPFTSLLLLITIIALIFALQISKWQLFKQLAYICAIIHLLFTCFSISIEYSI